MTDTITLTGVVATAPRHVTTNSGLSITTFRLASTHRKLDKTTNQWVDGETNWYTISCFRQLAANTRVSIKLGERVVVTGRLKIRPWQSGDKTGTAIEIDAEAVGHDLSWGFVSYTKGVAATPPPDDESSRVNVDDSSIANPDTVSGAELVMAESAAGSPSAPDAASWAVAPLGSGVSTPF